MNTADLTVAVAATWRITRLVTTDEVARPLREAVSERWPGSRTEYLVNCPYCVSVWAGVAVAIAPTTAVRALAFSAGALAARWTGELVEVVASNRRS